jgi:uncharacterized protein (UPF0335 family)
VVHNDERARMLERIQALMQDQEELAQSMKEMLEEAKSKGLNPAALKRAAALRMSSKKREKFVSDTRSLFDYMEAAGEPLTELA